MQSSFITRVVFSYHDPSHPDDPIGVTGPDLPWYTASFIYQLFIRMPVLQDAVITTITGGQFTDVQGDHYVIQGDISINESESGAWREYR
jgi:hypothetical protein